ncbi:MAG TPA: hypothetical protein DIC60_04640 [Lachnospiraceae bacterium]|nr:hypothetical protein [Lachnospiraceae bacterium]
MNLQHKVKINISDQDGNKKNVLNGTLKCLPKRLLNLLFGEFTEVLVLIPGQSVKNVEIHEIKGGSRNAE